MDSCPNAKQQWSDGREPLNNIWGRRQISQNNIAKASHENRPNKYLASWNSQEENPRMYQRGKAVIWYHKPSPTIKVAMVWNSETTPNLEQ